MATVVAGAPGLKIVEVSGRELAQSLPKKLDLPGVSLKGTSVTIHREGIDVVAQVVLDTGAVLTATTTMAARAEGHAVLLVAGDVSVEGAPDPLTKGLATAVLREMLQDPQWTRLVLPTGRVLCVEAQEGRLLVALSPHTPTPTNTPIPLKVLATMFPSNAVYGFQILARAGALITPLPAYEFDTKALVGLEGRISFPAHEGPLNDLLLRTLDPVLTQGMVLRRSEAEGAEEYCNCTMGVKLGDQTVDICWAAGRSGPNQAVSGRIYTRLHVIRARVAGQFYEIESDVNRLRQ